MRIHCRHLERVIGSGKLTLSLAISDLQPYVNSRVTETGRRDRNVSATTIRKELATFRTIWVWAVDAGVVEPVPVEKSGLNKDHRYDDHILLFCQFQWQSQNRTKQESKHGRMIHDHQQMGIDVHLFIRRHKVLDGKAAPFAYWGQVDFESWEGDAPISVIWNLRDPVPGSLQSSFRITTGDGSA